MLTTDSFHALNSTIFSSEIFIVRISFSTAPVVLHREKHRLPLRCSARGLSSIQLLHIVIEVGDLNLGDYLGGLNIGGYCKHHRVSL